MKRAVGKLFFTLLSALLIVSTAGAQIPPGALIWFKADAGIIEDGIGVSTWQDQSGNNNHANRASAAAPHLATVSFPSGDQPVIRFNADSWLLLTNSQALTPTDFTVFAVISVEPSSRSTYFCNYSNAINWGYGFTLDTNPDRSLHIYTGDGSPPPCYSDWFTGPGTSEGAYHIITNVVNGTAGTKTIYLDGSLLENATVPCLAYHPTVVACIGSLKGLGLFNLDGDIAELIMYPSVDTMQQDEVEQYLSTKYGIVASPPPPPVIYGGADPLYLQTDLNQDYYVNLEDAKMLMSQWLTYNYLPGPPPVCGGTDFSYMTQDIDRDCDVDLTDFAMLGRDWQLCYDPCNAECESYWDIIARREAEEASTWVAQKFASANPDPPISFVYDGVPSSDFLNGWLFSRQQTELDAQRTQYTLTYTDPVTSLQVRCVATEYNDYPAVEWVVYFKNTSGQNSPIIEDIQALNVDIVADFNEGDFKLRYSNGCNTRIIDFKPHDVNLVTDSTLELGPSGGRSSSALLLPPETDRLKSVGVMPYFNLSKPDGTGVMLAVGWSGQWAASFTKTNGTTANVQAGMELTHLKLYPGEEIRTPAILLLLWSGGSDIRGHNQLRQLLLNHYSPTPGGLPVDSPVAASPHGTIGFCDSAAASMIQGINNVADNLPLIDTWWIDAGWYTCQSVPGVAPWNTVGTWQPDPGRYPSGLKPVADAAHARGLKFLLWFEVERAVQDTWVYDNHPDWLLQHGTLPPDVVYQDPFYLVNFGHPDALAWAKTTFSQMVQDVGIDIYRIDLNMDPLYYWRNGETNGRQGVTEIKYIMGWYEYLDTLMLENPDLLIDNCAGGGRRLDFEMVRRSVSLLPSDYLWEPVGEQAIAYGLSLWIPLHGIGSVSLNPYDFRSGMGTSFVAVFDYYNSPGMWPLATEILNEYISIKDLYSGDFYPITPYSVDPADWMAWQFDRPDLGYGMVQAFRRSSSPASTGILKLQQLDSTATYTITNLDVTGSTTASGDSLMNTGLTVDININGSAIITYQKQ